MRDIKMTYNSEELKEELSRDEGRRAMPYKDTKGIWTVGVGRNLEANGLPVDMLVKIIERSGGLEGGEIDELLTNDIREAEIAADALHPAWRELSDTRQRVLLNMALNMGVTTFSKFRKFWSAVRGSDWLEAGREMEDSAWWDQVGPRAVRLREMLEAE